MDPAGQTGERQGKHFSNTVYRLHFCGITVNHRNLTVPHGFNSMNHINRMKLSMAS